MNSNNERDKNEQNSTETETQAESLHIDPVCKMKVPASRAAAVWTYKEKNYYFCNPRCKTKFQNEPSAYLPQEDESDSGSLNNDLLRLRSFYLPEGAFTYSCPMHPEIRQSKPGDCPICGMALEADLPQADSEQSDELKDLKKRLLPSAVLTAVLLAVAMPAMFGFAPLPIPHQSMPYIEMALSLPVVFYGAFPIFKKAIDSAWSGHLNMFSLIAFGISISIGVSLWSVLILRSHGHEMLYFESAASITTLVLLGQVLETAARSKSSGALESLFALAPGFARRKNADESSRTIPVYLIEKGDILRVLPGDRIPVDASVESGESTTDESMLSGNSLPVPKSKGDKVYAGTLNGEGVLVVRAESLGRQTVFAQIIQLLAKSQKSRSPMQEIADRASAVFIPAVILLAGITFFTWYFLGGSQSISHAVKNTINVLVIACPCALGLATPIAVSLAVARAAKLGLMVKDARALELLGRASRIFFDKTGTLTYGKFELTEIVCAPSITERAALQIAASLEQESKHPIARAILDRARREGIEPLRTSEFQSKAGLGLKGKHEGRELLLGNQRFMEENGIGLNEFKNANRETAATKVFVASDAKLQALIKLEDKLKPESVELIGLLKALGLRPGLLSGDGESSVRASAAQLALAPEDLGYSLMPQDKVSRIEALKAEGEIVAMVGDGVNDAAALAASDAGIAMASGSDVAISSAALTAMSPDLKLIVSALRLSRKMTGTMKENLFLAFIYNIAALLLATGIFYPQFGLELNPAIAAAAMSFSSISVILNSLKISRFE